MAGHLLITGRVQGVGYRFSLRQQALRLGLTGWVRNRHDGSVEAMVAGTPDAIAALAAWAHRGPPAAKVDAVTESPAEGDFDGFELLPTA